MKYLNKVICGDSLEVLKTLPDNSIDAVITDPPYGIGFMGKEWDTFSEDYLKETQKREQKRKPRSDGRKVTGFQNAVYAGTYDLSLTGNKKFQDWCFLWAKECLRVLKPGGHLLSFGGSRTYHRMACAIEDAGFEIRDQIMWVYGSGFPKSLNIGKAIDKRNGESIGWFGKWLKDWRLKNDISQKEISKLFPSKSGGLTGCVANWELGLNLPTNEQFNLICKTFNLPFVNLKEAEREIIGKITSGIGKAFGKGIWQSGCDEVDITKGNSEWEGYGTALKPAHEPIVVARKPLSEKTVAENVLKWGAGGLNIDECRITTENKKPHYGQLYRKANQIYGGMGEGKARPTQGRFPANLIHDGSPEVMTEFGDKARFFYCAKASKKERDAGLEGVEDKESIYPGINTFDKDGNRLRADGSIIPPLKAKNNHPTVKPLALMRYLIKLVTREGQIVLDPFLGSGTTAIAAKSLNRKYIGIEMSEEYCKIARLRIKESK